MRQHYGRSAVLKMDGVNLTYNDHIVVQVVGEYWPLDCGEFLAYLFPGFIRNDLFCFFLMPFVLFSTFVLRLRIR